MRLKRGPLLPDFMSPPFLLTFPDKPLGGWLVGTPWSLTVSSSPLRGRPAPYQHTAPSEAEEIWVGMGQCRAVDP